MPPAGGLLALTPVLTDTPLNLVRPVNGASSGSGVPHELASELRAMPAVILALGVAAHWMWWIEAVRDQ